MAQRQKRTNLRQLREHLVCVLCGGYLIDATTIVECLHSFCKTCIVRYLDSSKFCPICDVQVHKTKPLVNIRMDHTLQDMVYKLVPGLFKEEMRRRREFYKEKIDDDDNNGPWPEYYIDDDGEIQRERVIFSNDEQISLSLQLSADGKPPKSPDKRDNKSSTEMTDCRYLLCPAAVTVSHLKKFIRLKFNLCDRYQIDVYHTDEILQDHYTLMDIAYIYMWRRKGPLRLFYTVYTNPSKRLKKCASSTVTSDVSNDTSIVEMPNNTKPDLANHTDKQISSTIQNSNKIDDNISKSEQNRTDTIPDTSAASSIKDNVSNSHLELIQKVDKLATHSTPDSTKSNETNRKEVEPKTKEVTLCTSINVPTPHRSFLLGPKPTRKESKSEKRQKDFSLTSKQKDHHQILRLPVKQPEGKITVPQIKPADMMSKSLPISKTSNAFNTQIPDKTEGQDRANESTHVTNNNNSNGHVNTDRDKSTNNKNNVGTDRSCPSEAKKAKLNHDATSKSAIYKNGSDNSNQANCHPYITKPAVTLVGSAVSSGDKTRKLLHIPERPIHAYVPMAHYQGMNGLFHYRAHIQDYGNDAPQDLSMKKKSVESIETSVKATKPDTVDDNRTKRKEKEKNGEVDKYAFTDDDAAPVTSRKLQHVKSEPVALN